MPFSVSNLIKNQVQLMNDHSYQYIALRKSDSHTIVMTLNRPERLNAFNEEMVLEMVDAVNRFNHDPESKILIITGSGRSFCAGADIALMRDDGGLFEPSRQLSQLHELVKGIYCGSKPVIAAVNGAAAGGGASLAICCDYTVVNDDSFIVLPFLNLGILPDVGALYFLPRRVGITRAQELCWSQRRVYGKEALAIGLSTHYASDGANVLDEALRLAQDLAKMPSRAVNSIKQMLHHSLDKGLEEWLQEERIAQSLFMASEEHKEGKKAFLEKRKPNFHPFE